MSVDEVPIVHDVSTRLRALLARVRQLKTSSYIDSPIPVAELKDIGKISDIESDEGFGGEPAPVPRLHAAFETAARGIFYEALGLYSIDDPDFVEVWNLLDIVSACSDEGQCDGSLSLWLIEELLDSQTIDGCRRVFDYLESRRDRLITDTNRHNKQMIVLRSCNELLRRLSRAEDAVFCGRVFIFLFQSFPLGDKSAVNLRGEFHTENVTSYEDVQTPSVDAEAMEVDAEMKAEETSNIDTKETAEPGPDKKEASSQQTNSTKDRTPTIVEPTSTSTQSEADPKLETSRLYSTFWSLQSLFSNPTKLFNDNDFSHFKRALELTLRKFKCVPKIQTHRPRHPTTSNSTNSGPQGTKRKHSEIANGTNDTSTTPNTNHNSTFTPKYLTTPSLLTLELSDPTFQRHILVQSLIILDFLLSLTPRSKAKNASLKSQKALQYPYTLSPSDTEWTVAMRKDISAYLSEGADGKFYFRMIDNVLARDRNWVRWKMESCPPISLPAISPENYKEAMEGARKLCAPRRMKAAPLGSLNFDFLNDDPAANRAHLDVLRNPERYAPPSITTLLRQIDETDLDVDMIGDIPEEDNRLQGAKTREKARLRDERSCSTWRALRLGRRNRLRAFAKIDEAKSVKLLDPEAEEQELKNAEAEAEARRKEEDEVRQKEEDEARQKEEDEAQRKEVDKSPRNVGKVTGERQESESHEMAEAEAEAETSQQPTGGVTTNNADAEPDDTKAAVALDAGVELTIDSEDNDKPPTSEPPLDLESSGQDHGATVLDEGISVTARIENEELPGAPDNSRTTGDGVNKTDVVLDQGVENALAVEDGEHAVDAILAEMTTREDKDDVQMKDTEGNTVAEEERAA